jgi:hypothetical protein
MASNAKKKSKLLMLSGLFFASFIMTSLNAQEGPRGGGRGGQNGGGQNGGSQNRDGQGGNFNDDLTNAQENLQALN